MRQNSRQDRFSQIGLFAIALDRCYCQDCRFDARQQPQKKVAISPNEVDVALCARHGSSNDEPCNDSESIAKAIYDK